MSRKKIGLIGGGQIGSILALLIAQKELGDVVILDRPELSDPMKGKALDMMALRPHGGYDVNLSGSGDYADLAGADVLVITAGLPRKPGMTRDDLLQTNLGIIGNVAEQVKKYCPDAFVIITTNPLDAMVYAFYKLSGLPKERVIGMAGALDSGRFEAFVAMETGLSVEDVSALVLGGHGPTMIPLVRTATVGGVPLEALLSKEKIDAIAERTREAGTEVGYPGSTCDLRQTEERRSGLDERHDGDRLPGRSPWFDAVEEFVGGVESRGGSFGEPDSLRCRGDRGCQVVAD